jgi:hypothetical protein
MSGTSQDFVWQGADYVRVPEGLYQASAVRWRGPDWVRPYSRWSLLLEFELLDDGKLICAFYNFGENPKPEILRNGKYFKAWTMANGELPRKGQDLLPEVFMEGQIYTVEVEDNRQTSTQKQKSDAEIYSVVREIVHVDRGLGTNIDHIAIAVRPPQSGSSGLG